MFKHFAKYSPCLYKGEIRCVQCDRKDYCDMKAGRELKEKSFIAGYRKGYSHGKSKKLIKPTPAPRYDEVFFKGVAELDKM